MRPDPKVRPDGKCANPGCDNMRKPERSRRYGKAAAELDPFCSTVCAKAWHDVDVQTLGGAKG
jgi:hypothetical protein